MKFTLLSILLLFFNTLHSQSFNYYHIGDTSDILANPTFGICLMGGATENDEGASWFLNNADQGNILVLRTSGSDGYHNYFYNELGIPVQSVETIVFNDASAANSPFVLDRIEKADAIWFAGGDQYLYESYWKGTDVENLINNHINIKKAPIGGTSAGMAILGEYYFNAENGTISSNEALNNPYDQKLTIGSDFLITPFLENTITDTHYDNPDRKGRHLTFIARMQELDSNEDYFGIAADEYVAVCIDSNGIATVYGDHPDYDDNAYFLRTNCDRNTPSIMQVNTPLTWNATDAGIIVSNIKGTLDGSKKFNLNNWENINGGNWEKWTVEEGTLNTETIQFEGCINSLENEITNDVELILYPNPTRDILNVKIDSEVKRIEISDSKGSKLITEGSSKSISISDLPNGVYTLKLETKDHLFFYRKIIIID